MCTDIKMLRIHGFRRVGNAFEYTLQGTIQVKVRFTPLAVGVCVIVIWSDSTYAGINENASNYE